MSELFHSALNWCSCMKLFQLPAGIYTKKWRNIFSVSCKFRTMKMISHEKSRPRQEASMRNWNNYASCILIVYERRTFCLDVRHEFVGFLTMTKRTIRILIAKLLFEQWPKLFMSVFETLVWYCTTYWIRKIAFSVSTANLQFRVRRSDEDSCSDQGEYHHLETRMVAH